MNCKYVNDSRSKVLPSRGYNRPRSRSHERGRRRSGPRCKRSEFAALAGIVTDRDIAIKVVAAGRDPRSTRVDEVMSTDIVTCCAEDDYNRLPASSLLRSVLMARRNSFAPRVRPSVGRRRASPRHWARRSLSQNAAPGRT